MKNNKKHALFDPEAIRAVMESMRRPNGAFIASPTPDYWALWIRDHLYATFAYWYLEDFEKLKQGVWLIFDLLQKYEKKLKIRSATPAHTFGGVLHAKYDPDNFEEITPDDGWGHHQLDALGLFLYIVADLDFKNIRTIRNEKDTETIQLLIYYLNSSEYWNEPDYGMWEECKIPHASSIGAVVGGLTYVRKQRLVIVPDPLIQKGEEALNAILPLESIGLCSKSHHSHDCDAAQLSLIWPYHVIVNPVKADELISRIVDGHTSENGEFHRFAQDHGLQRHWGDDYYRSTEGKFRGISASWPMFKFWLSIIYSQRHEYEKAERWFNEGCLEIIDNKIPEAFQNGKPNDHTPLAWAHAIALIAWTKLSQEIKNKFLPS